MYPWEDRGSSLALGDLEAKWRSFGWAAKSVDGHSFDDLMAAFAHAGETSQPYKTK